MILTMLKKPKGLRHYRAFLFNTDVQSAVEHFMLMIHCEDYYWCWDPLDLKKNEVGNFMYNGLWVMTTEVNVSKKGYRFTIK